MKYLDATPGGGGGTATRQLTRKEKLESVAAMFKTRGGQFFLTVHNIEHMTPETLRQHPIAGTVLEPVAEHLNKIGVPTGSTLAAVMDSLEMDQEHLHAFACFCHHDKMAAESAAHLLATMANPQPIPQDTNRFARLSQTD